MAATKSTARQRRVNRSRKRVRDLNTVYISVHRTPRHIYAQVFSASGHEVLASASSLEKELKKQKLSGKIAVAEAVGALVAKRAKAKGLERVAFERSGYQYHGRVKALAESLRANGLMC